MTPLELSLPLSVALVAVEVAPDWTEAAVTTFDYADGKAQFGVIYVPHTDLDKLTEGIAGRRVLTHTSADLADLYRGAGRQAPDIVDILGDCPDLNELCQRYGVVPEEEGDDCLVIAELITLGELAVAIMDAGASS